MSLPILTSIVTPYTLIFCIFCINIYTLIVSILKIKKNKIKTGAARKEPTGCYCKKIQRSLAQEFPQGLIKL